MLPTTLTTPDVVTAVETFCRFKMSVVAELPTANSIYPPENEVSFVNVMPSPMSISLLSSVKTGFEVAVFERVVAAFAE